LAVVLTEENFTAWDLCD